jgi:protocatechuate 3,4-dioxygenase beta subunit
VGIINIPIAAASAETQGVVIAPEKGMAQGFSLWQILPDWEPSKPLEITIPVYKRTRVLTGTVVDSNGKAVSGAVVGCFPDSPLNIQTDEKGRFEYYNPESPIETLFAYKEGIGGAAISPDYEEAEKWKAMSEGTEEWRKREKHNNGPFTLKLSKGIPISIRVVNHEGNPVEGAWVAPTHFSTDYRYTKEIRSWNACNLPRLWGKKTDADGMVQFDSVPTEGFDMVTFDAFGDDPRFMKESKSKQFGNGSAIWRLQANNNELVISLPRRILIEGSVRNADGTPPPPGMQIGVNGSTGWGSVGTHLDYAGNFTFFVNANEVISVQPIYNSSRDPKGGVAPARLNVPVGKGWGEPPAPRFDFVLEKGTQVKGKIIAKEAFSQTYIQVYDDAAGTGEMTEMSWRFIVIDINEQGEFDMRLPNGRYRFKVRFQTADGEWGDKIIAKPLVINGEDEVRFDLEI